MEDLTEEEIQKAYLEIALEKMLTIALDSSGLPFVPPHWRDAAVERGLDNKNDKD